MATAPQPIFDMSKAVPIQAQPAPAPLFDMSKATPIQAPSLPQGQAPNGAMQSVGPAPTGAGAWLNGAENDVRYGGTSTIIGKLMHGLGAQGINRGVSEGAADQIGGPIVGPIRAAQGVADMGQHPVLGGLKALSGLIQTASPALAFAAPEAAEEAATIPSRISGRALIDGSKDAFQEVMGAAKNVPIDTTAPGNTALQIKNMADRGGSLPKVVNDFLKRATDPSKGPVTYEEGRDFASNAGKLSVDEMNKLKPAMKRMIGQFAGDLGQANANAADEAGKLPVYQNAMQNYSTGMQRQAAIKLLKGKLAQGAAGAVGGGIGGYAVTKGVKAALGSK